MIDIRELKTNTQHIGILMYVDYNVIQIIHDIHVYI